MSDARQIKASSDVVSRVVDGEAVLLDLASGKYFGLNEVGARVWEEVQEETPIDTVVERLLGEFDVEADTLRKDVAELITELEEKGLISVR